MKLVLIDRDGVINEELPHYVKSVDELVILEPALKGIALLTRQGFTCAVATNQSVVGRGIITRAALDRIHGAMCDRIREHGGKIEEIFVCADRPDEATDRRKPGPGMLIEALHRFGAVAEKTPFIGDAVTDLEAAHRAGCPRYLVLTGKGRKTAANLSDTVKPVTVCADLLDASQKIVETYR